MGNCMPKWGITEDEIRDRCVANKFETMRRRAKSTMDKRTKYHEFFGKVSHMQSLYDHKEGEIYSEGSTQAIKRKIRSETIQRVPDGEIITQYDKNSLEQVEIEFLFKNKVLTSEYDGKDMLKNLWRTFNMSYDYGYGCVRTGFERDLDGDFRITYTLIPWNDVLPAPDCKYIEEAEWYMIREFISRAELEQLMDWEADHVKDSTYEDKTVKYLLENWINSPTEPQSIPLADRKAHNTPIESVEVYTLYKRGKDEFITFVPGVEAILRKVKNYDPRKDVPIHFLILEPDPDWPLGCSSIMYTLGQQQFADAFQTLSYQTLLLAAQPPLMGFGNLTPQKIRMKPRAYWPMGTNQNNRIEPFKVETTTLTSYGQILQNVSANMMKNLNITESTVATDAQVMTYSGTPQGVEQQKRDKTVTVNQYQKRMEVFFSEWANHALRSYLNAMGGKQKLTVDEWTRRRVMDIESSSDSAQQELIDAGIPTSTTPSIIDGNKIEIDFSELKSDVLEFQVRTGSLIENEKEQERENIQQLIVPLSQMLGAVSDENKPVFEQNIMDLVARLCELSNIDLTQTTADRLHDQLLMQGLQATMEQVMMQQQQMNGMQQQLNQLAPQPEAPEGALPPEGLPPEGMPPAAPEAQVPAGMPPAEPQMPMPEPGVMPSSPAPVPGM